jgi:hypothetical protein
MKLTVQKGTTSVSIEMDEMDMSDILDSFIYMLYGLGFSIEEIEAQILKASEIIKNNHKQDEPTNKSNSVI